MSQNEKAREDQYWDMASECAAAVAYDTAAILGALAGQPWTSAGVAFNAITSSTACIAKVTSLASGQTVEQYAQLSGAVGLLDPWGKLLAAATRGETLTNTAPANLFSAGQSQTELLFEKLSKPGKFRKADYAILLGDLIKYASSSGDVKARQDRLLGVSLLDKADKKSIPLYDAPLPKRKEE